MIKDTCFSKEVYVAWMRGNRMGGEEAKNFFAHLKECPLCQIAIGKAVKELACLTDVYS